MENQDTQQQETSDEQAKNGNGGKDLRKSALGLGIIMIYIMMSACVATSRPSNSAEIAVQMKFQEKWNAEQKEAEQKWDSTLKVTEQKQVTSRNINLKFDRPK